jgi:hypothetical protein
MLSHSADLWSASESGLTVHMGVKPKAERSSRGNYGHGALLRRVRVKCRAAQAAARHKFAARTLADAGSGAPGGSRPRSLKFK